MTTVGYGVAPNSGGRTPPARAASSLLCVVTCGFWPWRYAAVGRSCPPVATITTPWLMGFSLPATFRTLLKLPTWPPLLAGVEFTYTWILGCDSTFATKPPRYACTSAQ